MPNAQSAAVVWAQEHGHYVLHERRTGEQTRIHDAAQWFAWLDTQRSFSFQGASGRVSLLKEARTGSRASYWYAYRRHGSRTRKQYAGRSADLTFSHLEAIAQALSQPSPALDAAIDPPPRDRAGRAATSPELLLVPKLQLPRLQTALIARDRLLAALHAGSRRILMLLCAPPGYGKTTLVRQWLHAQSDAEPLDLEVQPSNLAPLEAAWVALDAGDNDPIRFWRYLITACRLLQDDAGAAALAQLQLPPQPTFEPSPLEPALTTFLNALAHTARPGLLILDDYHVITAPRIHETMTFFLEHLPATLHVVIITRHQPPLPLARLRARGELSELATSDLRFTADEMAAFLERDGAPSLSPALRRHLGEQLEGWPAGLRLLALALHGSATPAAISATLSSFGGSQRPILEYFLTEVLHAQPARIQDFLLHTSMLRRLSAPLCDAILGTTDSAAVLVALEQANLFLEPLDGSATWHRYHALFAEAMQAEARQRLGAETVRQLSARASQWYEQHDMRADAIEAALHAQDTNRAADLLAQIAVTAHLGLGSVHLNTHSEFHTLRRWLEHIPDAAFQQRPVLFVSYATALLFVSLVDQVPTPPAILAQIETLLQQAETAFRTTNSTPQLGEIFAFRAMITRQRGALDDAVQWGRQALACLPPDDLSWRSIALGAVGMGALAQGVFADAEAAFQEAYSLCERIGNRWWTRANAAMLSFVLLERGMLHQAAAQFQQMLAEAREQADQDDVARAQICLAQIAYEWNDLDAAHDAAAEALALGEHLTNEEIWVQAALVLARVQHAQGQTSAALQRLTVLLARLQAQLTPLRARLAREVQLAQATIQLAAGDEAAVQRWAQNLRHDTATVTQLLHEREARLVARLHIAQRDADSAAAILTPMLAPAQANGRTRCTLEIRMLLALAHAARGQHQIAAQQLRRVLLDAAADGYQRLFLDQGAAVRELLHTLRTNERHPRLQRLLEALLGARAAPPSSESHAAARPPPLVEPLSQHERRVLRLLVAGRSNPEIARELIVSVNTVRTHVQSIYRKLGVHNRVAASDCARRLNLLHDER